MANEIQELKFQVGEVWKGVYSPSTAYGLANVVQDPTGLSVYRSLKSGNVGHPVTDTSWWFCIIDMSSIKEESDRIAALNQAIAQDEALRVAAEELRQQHEAERVAAETLRNEAEQARISAEQQRVTKEAQRETNEEQRITAEQGRVSDESARVQAEQARVLSETLRANAEDQRAANEQNRIAAEQQRIERAEQDHDRAESDHAALEVYFDSLGAFDISSYHATGGVLAKYADLTAALGTNGANIPDTLRKGGMSVKFVLSSDNKYVQYRLMTTSFSTNESDWQGVDEEPTSGSHNLVESGGILTAIKEKSVGILNDDSDADLNLGDNSGYVIVEFKNGDIRTRNFDSKNVVKEQKDDSEADLNIGDANGNVIVEFKNGGLKTKNIDLSVTNYFEQDIKFVEPRSGAPARLWTSSTLTNKTKDEWLVIYCPGNGHSRDSVSIPQTALSYFRRNKINVATISYQTTLYGESCEAWGSDAAYNAVVDLYTYLMANYGFRRDVILAGGSMGGLAMGQLAYKRPFPIRCCLGFGIVPGLDICWERSGEYSPTIKAQIRQTFGLAADGSQDSLYAEKSIGYDYRKYGWISVGETDYKVGFPNFYIYYGNDSAISGLFGGVENYNTMCQAFINAGMYSVVKSMGAVGHDSPTIWDAYVQDNIFYKELRTEKYI